MDTTEDQGLSAQEQRRADPARVLAFSDGVFAIIITILVLELKVPDLASGQSLLAALEEIRPTFVAFVISFMLVGMYWVGHRDLFARVRYVNRDVVWLNLLFLLPASMIPFVSSLIGEFPDEPVALHLYGVVLITLTLVRLGLTWYLMRHPRLLWEAADAEKSRLTLFAAGVPLLVYLAAMLLADTAASLSLVLYASMPLLYFILITFLRSDRRTRSGAQDLS